MEVAIKALIDSDLLPFHINTAGYKVSKRQYVHRLVAEKALGRKLKKTEVVHHVNYDKLDNRPENLIICCPKYHRLIHARTNCINAGFNPETHALCSECKTYHLREEFPKYHGRGNGLHNVCKLKSNSIRSERGYSVGKFNWLQRLQQQYRRVNTSYTKRDICWVFKEKVSVC